MSRARNSPRKSFRIDFGIYGNLGVGVRKILKQACLPARQVQNDSLKPIPPLKGDVQGDEIGGRCETLLS